MQDPFIGDGDDTSNSLRVAQFNESHIEFHVNVTGSEDGRLPQKPDASLARARCGVVVRESASTEKDSGKQFHGLGEGRPTAKAARLGTT